MVCESCGEYVGNNSESYHCYKCGTNVYTEIVRDRPSIGRRNKHMLEKSDYWCGFILGLVIMLMTVSICYLFLV